VGDRMREDGVMWQIVSRRPTVEEYVELRRSVGWPSPDVDRCSRALMASAYAVVGVTGEGAPVGMGRLVGDGAAYLFMVDVVVSPEVQGLGLSGALTDALAAWAADSGAGHVALAAAPDVVAFYARRGFALDESSYMRQVGSR